MSNTTTPTYRALVSRTDEAIQEANIDHLVKQSELNIAQGIQTTNQDVLNAEMAVSKQESVIANETATMDAALCAQPLNAKNYISARGRVENAKAKLVDLRSDLAEAQEWRTHLTKLAKQLFPAT